MFDVSCPVRPEHRLHILAQSLTQMIVYINQVFPAAVSDIKRTSRRFGGRQRRFEIRLNDIVNIGKVSGLLPIPVDHRHFPVK